MVKSVPSPDQCVGISAALSTWLPPTHTNIDFIYYLEVKQ